MERLASHYNISNCIFFFTFVILFLIMILVAKLNEGYFLNVIFFTCKVPFCLILSLVSLQDGESVTGKNLLFAVFLGFMIVGIVLMCLLSKRDEKKDNAPTHSSFGAMLKYIVAPLKDRRMLLTIPLIAYSGLQQAFVW